MERSPEIEGLSLRLLDAMNRADAETLNGLIEPGARIVAASSTARWDPERSPRILAEQAEILGGAVPIADDEVEGWTEGSVAWALVRGRWTHPGHERGARTTMVFHVVGGHWRLVHWHFSPTTPVKDILGFEWTLRSMAEAVEEEQPDLSVAQAPDGTVTIVFTDIEGSTEHNVALGDRAWLDLLRRHNQVVRAQIAAHDGFEVKSAGDGFMVAFASARKAIRFAHGVQAAVEPIGIRVRAGVHTGEVIKDRDDFFGSDVALAARIAAAASGGQVLCSALVRELVAASREFEFGGEKLLDFKGFDEPKAVFELLRVATVPDVPGHL